MIEEILKEADTHWIAEDGLMSLTRDEFREPFPGQQLRTVFNDNGLYFKTVFLMVLSRGGRFDVADCVEWAKSVELLEVEPGLYNRNPGRDSGEAHDNVDAICAGSICLSFPPFQHRFAYDVCKFGEFNGWSFVNQNPGAFRPQQSVQGGHVAFRKLCGGMIPTVWEWGWFVIGMLIGMNKLKQDPSLAQLKWMRIEALSEVFRRRPFGQSWLWMPASFYILKILFKLAVSMQGGERAIFERYYTAQNPQHPTVLLAQALNL